jgi:hypothetical protein
MSGSTCAARAAAAAGARGTADEAVGGHAELERGLGGVLDDAGRAVFLAARARRGCAARRLALDAVDVLTHRADVHAGALRASEQLPASSPACASGRSSGRWMRCRRAAAHVLAQELLRSRIEQPHVEVVPLHRARAADPARAARGSTRPRPRRSRRDAPCDCRSGSSETARSAAGRGAAAPRQTSRRPGAWSCRGCACRPSASPSDRDRPGPPRASRSAGPSGVFCAWPTPDFDLALAIRIATRHGSATTP